MVFVQKKNQIQMNTNQRKSLNIAAGMTCPLLKGNYSKKPARKIFTLVEF